MRLTLRLFSRCGLLQYPGDSNDRLILSTLDSECRNPGLTGGKGSSLAVLSGLSQHLKSVSCPRFRLVQRDDQHISSMLRFSRSLESAINVLLMDEVWASPIIVRRSIVQDAEMVAFSVLGARGSRCVGCCLRRVRENT